jgi:hypothetical protein
MKHAYATLNQKGKRAVSSAAATQANNQHRDCFFLFVIMVLSTSPYIFNLGFYSDDWSTFGRFTFPKDQSVSGIFAFAYDEWVRMRPVQILYQVLLYKAFGLRPLGYHLVNTGVLLAASCFCYLTLRRLTSLWFAAFQATLCAALYFVSLYADLRVVEQVGTVRIWLWKTVSLTALVVGTLGYELAMPLLFLSPFCMYWYSRQRSEVFGHFPIPKGRMVALSLSHWVTLVSVAVFKVHTTVRLGSPALADQLVWFVDLMEKTAIVSYGYLGAGLPLTALNLVLDHSDRVCTWASGLIGLLVFGYVFRIAAGAPLSGWVAALPTAIVGFFVFAAGYGIFLTQRNIHVGVTLGVGNRVAIIGALGVALSVGGVIGWLASRLPTGIPRAVVFSAMLTVFSVSGVVVNHIVADYWITAYEREIEVLDKIRQDFPALLDGSVFLLDGVCPYVGPGIVFDSDWDLKGALRLSYGKHKIRADVVGPGLQLTNEGLVSEMFGWKSFYPYGQNVVIYEFNSGRSRRLTSHQAACEYFETAPVDLDGCTSNRPGHGEPILEYSEVPPGAGLRGPVIRSLREACESLDQD